MQKWQGILCLLLALTLIAPALAEDWEEEREIPGYVEGDTLILDEGVTALGVYWGDWVYNPETDEWDEVEYPEEEAWFENSYSLDVYMGDPVFSFVQWPSTFRYLGGEAFVGYHFRELTLPGTLEKIYNDSVSGDIDVLRIEAQLPWEQVGEIRWDGNGMDNIIGAYEAPEGHPLYKTVDGVLFTKDGKTLLSYPTGRTATHYDVPKGVERIADRAFINEYLQTISLPIGLKEVGDYGFSGCTRLQSIALPLTVTQIGENVFQDCVSLELVSLPDGMQADKRTDDWNAVYYPDDRMYRGDNGDTFSNEDDQPEAQYNLYAPGRVKGSSAVQLYQDSTGEKIVGYKGYLDPGIYWLLTCNNGRVLLTDTFTSKDKYWVDAETVELLPTETLFSFADIRPRAEMAVWWDHLPTVRGNWPAWETRIPLDAEYGWLVCGPFVQFQHPDNGATFAARIQDADMYRRPDGTENIYGIVYSGDLFADIPLLDGPGGAVAEELMSGTQIRILAEDQDGYSVTTGIVDGWVAKENVKTVETIPEQKEGN